MSKKKARAAPPPPPPPPRSSDRWVGYAILPLRLFLGVTFVYAGLQKISDPGFLTPGAPTYIGTQLAGFATHSPIGFLINTFALAAPQLTGLSVIAAELAIGVATILGLWTRWAAAAGALVNLVLFLTASWTVQPYFLGSDSIYAVAWITIALTGDLGVLTVQRQLFTGLGFGPAAARPARYDPARRRMLLQAGGAAVTAIWVLSIVPRLKGNVPSASTTPTPSPSPAPTTTPTPGAASPSPVATPAGTKIGSVADLQSQGSLQFQDPKSGDPALAVQLSGGKVVAFDAVCTHAGCTVSYDSGQKLFVCPCHGAEFDPASNAAVVAGPAPTPLSGISVTVSGGDVYTA